MKRNKTLATAFILLVAMLVPTLALAVTPVGPQNGAGTKDDPYQITTEAELFWFGRLVNGDLEDISTNRKACVKLMNDITLTENWDPLGDNNGEQYCGTIDGNGKTISGLKIDEIDKMFVGLVGFMGSGGKVCNLNLADVDITGGRYVGAVCGSSGFATIENCTASGTIRGGHIVGGICGHSGSCIIRNCTNRATLRYVQPGPSNWYWSYFGGICGENWGDYAVEWCTNEGDLQVGSASDVGGICGANDGTVRFCTNKGIVSASRENVGGICGRSGGSILFCNNLADVQGLGEEKGCIGGVCGYLNESSNPKSHIISCYNAGALTIPVGVRSYGSIVGGVSTLYNRVKVQDCYYNSEVCSWEGIGVVENNSGREFEPTYAGKTTAQFKSGEVAYLLNNDTIVWRQKLDTNTYPLLKGEIAYKTGESTYGNVENGALQNLIIDDARPFAADADFTVASLHYDRTIPSCYVVCGVLPFDLTQDQIADRISVYTLDKEITIDKKECINLIARSGITANEPFFLLNYGSEKSLLKEQGITSTVAQSGEMSKSTTDGKWSLVGVTQAKDFAYGH